jgi:hypothetical protein
MRLGPGYHKKKKIKLLKKKRKDLKNIKPVEDSQQKFHLILLEGTWHWNEWFELTDFRKIYETSPEEIDCCLDTKDDQTFPTEESLQLFNSSLSADPNSLSTDLSTLSLENTSLANMSSKHAVMYRNLREKSVFFPSVPSLLTSPCPGIDYSRNHLSWGEMTRRGGNKKTGLRRQCFS